MVGVGWVTHGAPMNSPQNDYATIVLICQVDIFNSQSVARIGAVN
jgi:hypothetical protein